MAKDSIESLIKKGEVTPGLLAFLKKQEETARDRPARVVSSTMEIGAFVAQVRRDLKVRQVDLADRAHVGRQWLISLEQGKQTLEVELVMRTLLTLGFELELKPYTPVPPWIETAMVQSKFRRQAVKRERNVRRRSRRAAARSHRLAANAPKVTVDLD